METVGLKKPFPSLVSLSPLFPDGDSSSKYTDGYCLNIFYLLSSPYLNSFNTKPLGKTSDWLFTSNCCAVPGAGVCEMVPQCSRSPSLISRRKERANCIFCFTNLSSCSRFPCFPSNRFAQLHESQHYFVLIFEIDMTI